MDANTRNWIIGGVIAIIIIVLGWWLLTKPAGSKPGMAATSTSATTTVTTATSSNGSMTVTTQASGQALSVANQTAGSSVTVTGVSVSQTSWVAVRDSRSILGAARIPAGDAQTVKVPLLRATKAGAQYQVAIYTDDGDGAFDLHKDALVEGVGGSFSAQ